MKSPTNPSFFTISHGFSLFPNMFHICFTIVGPFFLGKWTVKIHGVHGSGDAQEDQVAEGELNEEPARVAGGSLLFCHGPIEMMWVLPVTKWWFSIVFCEGLPECSWFFVVVTFWSYLYIFVTLCYWKLPRVCYWKWPKEWVFLW